MKTLVTKTGQQILIRRPNENDAEGIINYAKVLFASTDQVLTLPEEYTMTVEREKAWINDGLYNPGTLILVAEHEGVIIGLLNFATLPKKKIAHTGEFGVNVHSNYQGLGIGRAMLEILITWARDNNAIEKVFLNVFHTNQKAINLYSAMGFVEEGRHIKAIKQVTGEYVDVIQMYIDTK